MATFGEQLKAARLARGLTLETVAKRINSHKGYVSGIERGKVNPPSARVVKKLAKLFNHVYEELLVDAELEKIHPDVRPYFRAAVQEARNQQIRPEPVKAVPSPSAPAVGEKAAG